MSFRQDIARRLNPDAFLFQSPDRDSCRFDTPCSSPATTAAACSNPLIGIHVVSTKGVGGVSRVNARFQSPDRDSCRFDRCRRTGDRYWAWVLSCERVE